MLHCTALHAWFVHAFQCAEILLEQLLRQVRQERATDGGWPGGWRFRVLAVLCMQIHVERE